MVTRLHRIYDGLLVLCMMLVPGFCTATTIVQLSLLSNPQQVQNDPLVRCFTWAVIGCIAMLLADLLVLMRRARQGKPAYVPTWIACLAIIAIGPESVSSEPNVSDANL